LVELVNMARPGSEEKLNAIMAAAAQVIVDYNG
jgi:hypothetical protein